MIGGMNVHMGIGIEVRALIKAPAPDGNLVDGRIDLQNDRLARRAQQLERAGAIATAAFVRLDAEMLDIDKIVRLPAQQQPDEFIAVIDQIEPIGRMRENRRLRRGLALLMAGKLRRYSARAAS